MAQQIKKIHQLTVNLSQLAVNLFQQTTNLFQRNINLLQNIINLFKRTMNLFKNTMNLSLKGFRLIRYSNPTYKRSFIKAIQLGKASFSGFGHIESKVLEAIKYSSFVRFPTFHVGLLMLNPFSFFKNPKSIFQCVYNIGFKATDYVYCFLKC